MIRFLADENFNGKILRGIRRERPDADVIRVQDTSIYQSPDSTVLEWAAQQERILLTHDIETMIGFANERVTAGLPMPGVIAARDILPIGQVIDDLLTILGASEMSDWEKHRSIPSAISILCWVAGLLVLVACSAASTTTPTPSPLPLPSPVPTDIDAFCPLPRNWVTYLTQPGDSLRSLAERTSSSITQLKTGNCLNNPRGLLSGQVFYLPRPPITSRH